MNRASLALAAALLASLAATKSQAASILIDSGSSSLWSEEGISVVTRTPTVPLNTQDTAGAGANINTTTYDFSNASFNITMLHDRDTTITNWADSYGDVVFTIQPDAGGGTLGYTLSGDYAVTDVDGGSSYVFFRSYLWDVTTSTYLAYADQESRSTSNQSFTLGGSAGDYSNYNSGNLTGTLVAGDTYLWYYDAQMSAASGLDKGASATGGFQLAFTDSSIAAPSPVPLPAAAPMAIPVLGLLGGWGFWRKRASTAS